MHFPRPIASALTFSALLLLGACASDIKVTHHSLENEKQLARLDSYCWAINKADEAMEALAPGGGRNALFDPSVRASINESLEEKGYRLVACKDAAFMVDYRMAIHSDVAASDASVENSPQSSIHDYGFKWKINEQADLEYKGLSQPEDILITVQHGTLHIAAFTPVGQLLWHGSAEKVLSERESERDRLKSVRRATEGTMEHFPKREP